MCNVEKPRNGLGAMKMELCEKRCLLQESNENRTLKIPGKMSEENSGPQYYAPGYLSQTNYSNITSQKIYGFPSKYPTFENKGNYFAQAG